MIGLRAAATILPAVMLAVLVTVLETAHASPGTASLGEILVRIDVHETGNATVFITFSGTGEASPWITLPKYEQVRACEVKGSFQILNRSTNAYFYVNSTVLLRAAEDGQYSLTLCYSFPYAVLMYEDRGWFMSPLLLADPRAQLVVHVRIPFVEKVTFESPESSGTLDGYRVYNLAKAAGALMQGRVIVEFTSQLRIPSSEMQDPETGITVEYPQPYTGIAAKTLEVARKSYVVLRSIAGTSPPAIRFRFYLPEQSLGGLWALGFVRGEDVNVGGRGPIMLNLALVRYAPGYHETTVIHEMVHVFLGAVGVEANTNTRWFHEGMAQYLSILVASKVGINVTDYASTLENSSRAAFQVALQNPGKHIEKWPSSEEEEGLAYLLSYYVVSNISSRYGGEVYVTRLFSALRRSEKVDSTRSVVMAMSEAAGENLAPLFRHLGFRDVVDWTGDPASQNRQRSSGGSVLPGSTDDSLAAAFTLLGLAIGLVAYLVDQRVRRELETYREKWRIEIATQPSPRG
uniref:Peptidase MA-like domain-containing protein n=1 Tax=Thermofilum pendens TaxID=2269 RepID=A0A7C3SLF6_THEPE